MLSGFFRKHTRKDDPSQGQRPVTERRDIPHDPSLVTALSHQHRMLTMLLVKASSAAQQELYDEVRETLVQFKTGLADHLKRESAELHPYLTVHLKGEESEAILKEMRANSRYIERAVEGFLSHYASYPVNERTVDRFNMELSGVSEEFCERIEKEEASLYTLYLPPDAY